MADVQDNRQAMAELQAGYVQRLRGRLETIEKQWALAHQHPSDQGNLEALYKEIHQVYGSAASFGLAAVSEKLRPLDLFLRNIIETETPLTSAQLDDQATHFQGFRDLVTRLLDLSSSQSKEEAAAPPRSPLMPATSALRILVAEGSGLFRRRLVLELSQAGFDVEEAENGLKALTRIQQQPPDLVLMDMMMPVLDGLQAVRSLREDPRLQELPIIMLATPETVPDVEQALPMGITGYITKPVHPERVVARVQDILEKHAGQDIS